MDDIQTKQSTSPVIVDADVEKEYLDFPEAIRGMTIGEKMTRMEWKDENEYGHVSDGTLMIHTKGVDHTWIVKDGDLMADDWYAIK